MLSKLLELLFFLRSKKWVFHNQETFPESRNFSTVMELFHKQITFPQSKSFSTVMESFHSQASFQQIMKFSTVKEIFHKKFTWSKKFSTKKVFQNLFFLVKEVLHKQIFLHKKNEKNYFFTICFAIFFKQTSSKRENNSSIFLHN